MSLCSAPTPPDNVTVTAVNSTHVMLTWNYPQNVIRECDAVYQRVDVEGVTQTTESQMVSGRGCLLPPATVHTSHPLPVLFTECESPIQRDPDTH